MTNVEEQSSLRPRRFTRKLLDVLGEQFPIGEDREEAEPQRADQDPLMCIASIAKRGWDLNDIQGTEQRVRLQAALPTVGLPQEDAALLDRWSPLALQEVMREQTSHFEHGVHGCKRDVARTLDPVQRGMITEVRLTQLFEAYVPSAVHVADFRYWSMIHPQWALLDPTLHTPAFVRSRSALLTTAICAVGSTALATLPEKKNELVAEAIALHALVEKLNLVVYMTGAKSVEIMQAQIVSNALSIRTDASSCLDMGCQRTHDLTTGGGYGQQSSLGWLRRLALILRVVTMIRTSPLPISFD